MIIGWKHLGDMAEAYEQMIMSVYAHNGVEAEQKMAFILGRIEEYTTEFEANPLSDAERVLGGHFRDWMINQVGRSTVPIEYGADATKPYEDVIQKSQNLICRTFVNLADGDDERIQKLFVLKIAQIQAEYPIWYSRFSSMYQISTQLLNLYVNVVVSEKIKSEIERIDDGGELFGGYSE